MRRLSTLITLLFLSLVAYCNDTIVADTIAILEPDTLVIQQDSTIYADSLLATARDYIGVRYMRGGSSAKGFDCSGFTTFIYKKYGITLLRSSRAQYTMGEKVELDELAPGDLVFFEGRKSGVVGHVGIAVENFGDGTFSFIHSSCQNGVIISRSTEPYYKRRYKGARRVVPLK